MMSPIDSATFEALRETTGAEFARDLVDTFLSEAPAMLDDLRQSLAAPDADRFRRAAHSLKSNSNTFGALALGALAKQLELSGVDQADAAALTALEAEYARVAAALTKLRHE
jgi:HPt (histidine-containing phosphotransfer) domain-containing protein